MMTERRAVTRPQLGSNQFLVLSVSLVGTETRTPSRLPQPSSWRGAGEVAVTGTGSQPRRPVPVRIRRPNA